MKAFYNWLKAQWRASWAATGKAPGHRPPPPRGRPVGGLTDTDYLLLLISTRSWP
jgi:hypothetical protein